MVLHSFQLQFFILWSFRSSLGQTYPLPQLFRPARYTPVKSDPPMTEYSFLFCNHIAGILDESQSQQTLVSCTTLPKKLSRTHTHTHTQTTYKLHTHTYTHTRAPTHTHAHLHTQKHTHNTRTHTHKPHSKYLSRFGAQTMARFLECMPVS
jgi:hypothetical protein